MPWFHGTTLMNYLEELYTGSDTNMTDARFPVQWVCRPQSQTYADFRGYAGALASGILREGDAVTVLPSGFSTKISKINFPDDFLGTDAATAAVSEAPGGSDGSDGSGVLGGGSDGSGSSDESSSSDESDASPSLCQSNSCQSSEPRQAEPDQAIIVRLADDIDVSRGDMIVRSTNLPTVSQDLDATICWMDQSADLLVRKTYTLLHTTRTVRAIVKDIQYKIDVNTLHREETGQLHLNEIGRVHLRTTTPLFFDEYSRNKHTGAFILIDEQTNNTVAAGILRN
jgi:sulfate adenylyltransferase subunit 1 (EFTu-like GTPase family)